MPAHEPNPHRFAALLPKGSHPLSTHSRCSSAGLFSVRSVVPQSCPAIINSPNAVPATEPNAHRSVTIGPDVFSSTFNRFLMHASGVRSVSRLLFLRVVQRSLTQQRPRESRDWHIHQTLTVPSNDQNHLRSTTPMVLQYRVFYSSEFSSDHQLPASIANDRTKFTRSATLLPNVPRPLSTDSRRTSTASLQCRLSGPSELCSNLQLF